MPTLNASARRLAVRSAIAASTGAAVLAFAPPSAAADPAPVPYPTGYRNWTHVKSLQIQSGHPLYDAFGGIHHLYANAKAMEGYRKGRFPDGAVIVFDLLTTVRGDLAMTEGARKAVIVMQKDSRRFAATDGWSYQVFGGPAQREPQLDASAAAGCHGCHTSQAGRDFVFSDWRE